MISLFIAIVILLATGLICMSYGADHSDAVKAKRRRTKSAIRKRVKDWLDEND